MKRFYSSFTILEIIFVLLLVGIINSQVTLKNNIPKLKLIKQQLILHLKYTKYIAMLDNKYDHKDSLWFRKLWTLKFLHCKSSIGGLYYIIYSDKNKNGYISKDETLKDPLTGNYIYSYECSKDSLYDKSKFVLLTQEYDIKDIHISCNSTDTIGQISFGNNGDIFTRLATEESKMDKYRLKNNCYIVLKDKKNHQETITIVPNTGEIY